MYFNFIASQRKHVNPKVIQYMCQYKFAKLRKEILGSNLSLTYFKHS